MRRQRASGRRAADTGSRRQRRRTARAPLRTAGGKFDCASRSWLEVGSPRLNVQAGGGRYLCSMALDPCCKGARAAARPTHGRQGCLESAGVRIVARGGRKGGAGQEAQQQGCLGEAKHGERCVRR